MSQLIKKVDVTRGGKNKPPDKESSYYKKWVVAMLKIMPTLNEGQSRYFHAKGIRYTISRERNICKDNTMTWMIKRKGAKFYFRDVLFLKYVVLAVVHIMKLKGFQMWMPHGNELIFSTSHDDECIEYEYIKEN